MPADAGRRSAGTSSPRRPAPAIPNSTCSPPSRRRRCATPPTRPPRSGSRPRWRCGNAMPKPGLDARAGAGRPPPHAPFRPAQRHDRRRAQDRARPEARLRRGRKPAGLAEGAGQLRHRRRPPRRGDALRRTVQGPAQLRLPRRGRRPARGHRQGASAGSSTRSTAPPTSCTASRISPSRSALEREGAIVAGLVYNPASEELFIAEKGKGAFLNDQRIRVAGRKQLVRLP